MSSEGPITDYLQQLACSLPHGRRSQRILAEIEEHLRDLAHTIEALGDNRMAAEAVAVSQFGDPQTVLAEFALQAPISYEVPIMARFVLTPLAALTGAYSSLFLFFALFDEAPLGFMTVKVLTAAGVFVFALFLLHQLWSTAEPLTPWRWTMWMGALLMIIVGTANTVWAAHLGLVSGDWEYYGFVGGAMIALEGALAATWLVTQWDHRRLPV